MSLGLAIVGCSGSGEAVQSSSAGPETGDGGVDADTRKADAGNMDAKDGAVDTVVDRTGDADAGADAVVDAVVDATDSAAPDGNSSGEANVDAGNADADAGSDAAVDCGPNGPPNDTCAEATNLGAISEGQTGIWSGSIQSSSDVDTFTITLHESSHACPPDASSPFFAGNITVTSGSSTEVDIVSDDAFAAATMRLRLPRAPPPPPCSCGAASAIPPRTASCSFTSCRRRRPAACPIRSR